MTDFDLTPSWILQVSVALPAGTDPLDFPALAALEDQVRSFVSDTERVTVDTFTVIPGAVRSYLVSILDFHVRQPDGSCVCGWKPDGRSHAEHVTEIFAESTRAHVTA